MNSSRGNGLGYGHGNMDLGNMSHGNMGIGNLNHGNMGQSNRGQGHMGHSSHNNSTMNMTHMMATQLPPDIVIAFITLTLLAFIGFIINAILVIIAIRSNHKKTAADGLVAHLSICDLLTTIPTLSYCSVIFVFRGFGWPTQLMNILCKATIFCLTFFYSLTVSTLTLMSIERYRAIIYPMKPRVSRKSLCILLVFMWLLVAIVPALGIKNTAVDPHNGYLCVLQGAHQHYIVVLNFSYCVIIGYIIPACIMLYCYSKIIKKLKQTSLTNRESLRIESQREFQKKRAIKILMAVSVVFILTGIPLVIGLIIHIYMDSKLSQLTHSDHDLINSLTLLFWILLQFAPLYNPIIYFAKKKNFWQNFNHKTDPVLHVSQTVTAMTHSNAK
ncbi:Neuropeptide FF receptor 2 [Trichoplax sp. H2]|nr:Neuropeptide FF receptor 2 [Trichoplax sp. H2]|eukprot:RDD37978.1 Neuropeptide FF receptor 2 [Trichoplax sp. H2]